MNGSGLGIFRAIDQATNARMGDRPGAHRAGLDRYVKLTVEQSIVADGKAGFAQSNDLGMCRGIIRADRPIAPPADDLAIAHNYRSDRNLSQRKRTLRFAQRFFHEQFVRGGHALEGNPASLHLQPGELLNLRTADQFFELQPPRNSCTLSPARQMGVWACLR